MKRHTLILRRCTPLLAAVLIFIAFIADSPAQTIRQLNIGTVMQVTGINIDDYYFGIMRAMLSHKGLVKIGEDGRITVDLARSWETGDAKTWTFHLIPEITWHDGTPVTATDIKFSFEYQMEKIPVFRNHFKRIDQVVAPDLHTLVIRLSEPSPRFLVTLAVLRTLPRHIFKSVDDPRSFQGKKAAMGCGPYQFDAFDSAAGIIRFKAYESYYRGRPNVDEIVFRMFKNPDTMYMALKKGKIDLPYFYAAGTDPVYAASLAAYPGITIHKLPNPGVPSVLFFNTNKPPMDNAKFRRALGMAIDYTEMIRLFAGGYGSIPNSGFVPRGSASFVETPALAYNPVKARALLSEIGYTARNGMFEKHGKNLTVEIVVRTDIAGSLRMAQLLKKRFARIGVTLIVKSVDTTLFRQISDRDRSHMTLLSRTTPWGMMMWAGCGSGYFDSRDIGWADITDLKFHDLVDEMNAAIKPDIYDKAAAALQQYYAEQLPGIPLYWDSILQPCNQAFSGWKNSPMYGFLWEDSWYSLKKGK